MVAKKKAVTKKKVAVKRRAMPKKSVKPKAKERAKGTANQNKTSKEHIKHIEKMDLALTYRIAGLSYAKIAAQIGCCKASAYKLVIEAIDEINKNNAEQADHLRSMEFARLDEMLMSVWPAARKGNVGSVDRVLKIMERRARLMGLDAPTKLAPVNPDGTSFFADLVREVVGGGS